MDRSILKIILKISAVTFGGLLAFFSLIPNPPQPLTFNGVDKLQHLVAYLFLGLLCLPAFTSGETKKICTVFISITCMGILIEIIQPFTGRHFDWFDILFNSSGIALSILGYASYKKFREKKHQDI